MQLSDIARIKEGEMSYIRDRTYQMLGGTLKFQSIVASQAKKQAQSVFKWQKKSIFLYGNLKELGMQNKPIILEI